MRIALLLCLLLAAPALAGDENDSVTMTHEQAAKLLARYRDALETAQKALAENAKLRERMDICWAGFGGFKN